MYVFCNSSASMFYIATHLIGEVCQISFLHFFLSVFYGQLFLISLLFYSLSFPSTYLNILSFNYFTVLHLSCNFSRIHPSSTILHITSLNTVDRTGAWQPSTKADKSLALPSHFAFSFQVSSPRFSVHILCSQKRKESTF